MKINKISLGLLLYLGYTTSLYAEEKIEKNVYFDPDFLELPNKDSVDLSQFENNEQLAGNYYVDIYVNTNLIGSKNLKFEKNNQNQLIPCLSLADIKEFGIKTAEYPELQTAGSTVSTLPRSLMPPVTLSLILNVYI